jgi:hypothetical protein
MNKFKYIGIILILFVLITGKLFAQTANKPVVFESGKAVITLEDHLHHPYYWWPATLLNYTVIFDTEPKAENFSIFNESNGTEAPFQFSEVEKLKDGKYKAVLSFMSDLPSGGKRTYVLQRSTSAKRFPLVKVEEGKQYITLQTDKLAVRLPASQGSSASCPGPVIGITDKQGNRTGTSSLVTPGKKMVSVTTQPVSIGPLFAEYHIHYVFEKNASYDVWIKCIKGYDFFEVREKIEGFSEADSATWEITWNGFSPTHRQAPNRPYFQVESSRGEFRTQRDNPGFGRFEWERIDQALMSSHHGIVVAKSDGRLPFQVDIYGNYPAEGTVTSSLFWDERSGQSIGVFMNDASFWNDRMYPIWHISGRLSVGFYYQDEQLSWKYPLISGQRTTAISCYDHTRDIVFMDELEKLFQPQTHPLGFTYRAKMSQLSYNTFFQNRYGTLHLDRVKDWVLAYPSPLPLGPVVFNNSRNKSVEDLEKNFLYHEFILELPVSGTCQNSGYGPTRNRQFYGSWVQSFNRLLPDMSEKDRERFIAMFLFHCYVAAEEEYMPMRNILSGHPNFLADVKTNPVMASFLFPEHPEAKKWEELFGKYIELNTHYHTRPEVTAWNARGGRWTENLGTYVWAFIRPTIFSNFLNQKYGTGRNFFAGRNQALIGEWLLNSLSAPLEGTEGNPSVRVYPPQGAHARYRATPSPHLWKLGEVFQNYDPLLGENLRYVSHPGHRDQNYNFEIMYPDDDNTDPGTPPDLKSAKYTGYGSVLRAAVGTENELSVHLSQIDEGHNYRWGNVARGGTGTIYFYAGGKSYSHNTSHDGGDGRVQDTDRITNFGVFKDGSFKAIGQNVLTSPLYDLEVGQFTEILSSKENPYSSPEYQSRSIMLVGADYFIIYDDVYFQGISSRFSWFTHIDDDLPNIRILKAGAAGYNYKPGDATKTELTGKETKGVWYEGAGDFMVFISHKDGFRQESKPYGAEIETPADGKDYIFRNDEPVHVDEPGMIFSGLAGFMRKKENGTNELAIFKGSRIGDENIVIETFNPEAGISAIIENPEHIHGLYYSQGEGSQLTFRWRKNKPAGISFYLNGIKQTVTDAEDGIIINIPAGRHIWNIGSFPSLPRPEIKFTRNNKGRVLLGIHPIDGAGKYRFEYSSNTGKTAADIHWHLLKEQSGNSLWIKSQGNETKGFVRVIAMNDEYISNTSVISPVYFTREKPDFPDGLKLDIISKNEVALSWGKVLGCDQYKLYRRPLGANDKYSLIYQGDGNQFRDNTLRNSRLYEYAVSSVNENGEGERCYAVNNDPDNWLNFDPMPGEPFRRTRMPSRLSSGEFNLEDREIYYPE